MGKMKNKKGFTLAEMLIVVAIIGILVAISTSVLSNRLETSRETADLGNIRNCYAELVAVAELDGEMKPFIRTMKTSTGGTCYCIYLKSQQKKNGWQTTSFEKRDGYIKVENCYVGAPYGEGANYKNVYQIKYYVEEQAAKEPTNLDPYHFTVTVIKESDVDTKTGYYNQ